MWNLLKKSGRECKKLQDSLEEAAAKQADAISAEDLLRALPPAERQHIAMCNHCRDAAHHLFATRQLLKGVASFADEARPWFAARVMGAIAARERELAILVNPWNEVPRFASRLAWITAIVLLAGTTWFYEKGIKASSDQLNATASQESIFEAQPQTQTNQDDVLISMAESNP